MLAHPSDHILQYVANAANDVDFIVSLVLVNFSRDDIKSVSDITRLGGKIISQVSTNVTGGPPLHIQ